MGYRAVYIYVCLKIGEDGSKTYNGEDKKRLGDAEEEERIYKRTKIGSVRAA